MVCNHEAMATSRIGPRVFFNQGLLDGKVIKDCMILHQDFIRFLKRIDMETLVELGLHPIADNYVSHSHFRLKSWF
jgi:hypothetical protein